MKRKICLTICLLIAFLVVGCFQSQDEQEFQPVEVESAEDVMQNVREGYDFIEGVKGTVVVTTDPEMFGVEEGKTRFWMKKDGSYKYRVEHEIETMVSNGSVTWRNAHLNSQDFVILMSKAFDEVVKTEESYITIFTYAPKPDTYWWINESNFIIMPKEPGMNLSGEEEVAGRDCYVVEVYEEVNQTKEIFSKLWVDKEYYYPLKIQKSTQDHTVGSNEGNFTIQYESIDFNPEIDDSKFEYQIPQDIQRICYLRDINDIMRGNCTYKEVG